MQSLDSRLADLFNEDGTAAEIKSQTEASESDSDSDTDLITRANRVLDMKQNVNVLPGLGDLDQVTEPVDKEEKATVEDPPQTSENKIDIAGDANRVTSISTTQENTSSYTETTLTPVLNQAIPVIGGISRVAVHMNDGSSTPTLDEKPYSPPAASKVYVPPPPAAPVAFSGDALSFLSKIMGNPAKPDVPSTESTHAPTVTQPSPVTATTPYATWPRVPPTWPPTNPITPSTVAGNLWSSPPPLPTLPPPPVFSWSGHPDSSLPPPWRNLTSTVARLPRPTATEAPTQTVGASISTITASSTGASMPSAWPNVASTVALSTTKLPTSEPIAPDIGSHIPALNSAGIGLPKPQPISTINSSGINAPQPQVISTTVGVSSRSEPPSSTSVVARPNFSVPQTAAELARRNFSGPQMATAPLPVRLKFPDPVTSSAPPPAKKSKWDIKAEDFK